MEATETVGAGANAVYVRSWACPALRRDGFEGTWEQTPTLPGRLLRRWSQAVNGGAQQEEEKVV